MNFKLKIKDLNSFTVLATLEEAALLLQKLVKALTGRESEIRYTGAPDQPSVQLRVDEGHGLDCEDDVAGRLEEHFRLFCDAVLLYREHSPTIRGDIKVTWHSTAVAPDVGATFDGNNFLVNPKLGSLQLMRLLRSVLLVLQNVTVSGVKTPSPPPGHDWVAFLRSQLREGSTLDELTGRIVGHCERPGELKVLEGSVTTKLVAAPHDVQELMDNFAKDRRGVAQVRADVDLLFGDVRLTLHSWAWLSDEDDAQGALFSASGLELDALRVETA